MKKHIFVVCAYQESPYLEECLKSLKKQVIPAEIILCTSTPNPYIQRMSEQFHVPLKVNETKGDIQIDWNYAYSIADAEYVTLVHQDDVYRPEYTECLYRAIEKYDDIVMFYTNYFPLKMQGQERSIKKDINCRLRSFLSFPMSIPCLANKVFWKKGSLRLGNSICCSSVTYHKSKLSEKDVFTSQLRYSLDWDTFLKLSDIEGRFVYERKELTYFRIHDKATSKQCIDNKMREKEDYIMFCKLWPRPVAKLIMIFYRLAYLNYK